MIKNSSCTYCYPIGLIYIAKLQELNVPSFVRKVNLFCYEAQMTNRTIEFPLLSVLSANRTCSSGTFLQNRTKWKYIARPPSIRHKQPLPSLTSILLPKKPVSPEYMELMTEIGSLFPERALTDAGPKTPRLLTSEQKYRVFDKIRTEIAGEARKTTFCKEF